MQGIKSEVRVKIKGAIAKWKVVEKKAKLVNKMAVVRPRVNLKGQLDAPPNVTPSLDDLLPFIYCCHRAKAAAFCDLKPSIRPYSTNLNPNICAPGAMPCRKNRRLLAHLVQLRAHPGRMRAPRPALILAGQTDSDLHTRRFKSRIL